MFEDAEQNQLFDDSKFESYRHAGELAFPQEMFDSAALSNILHDLENIECGGAISSWEIPQTPCNSPQFACSFDYARPQLASPFFYPWPPTWTSPSCPSTQPSPSSPPTTTFECMKSCQYQSPREPQTCSQIQKKSPAGRYLNKYRQHFIGADKRLLEQSFAKDAYPDPTACAKLAAQLCSSPRKVRIWFQNKRQAVVRKHLQKRDSSDAEPTVHENK